MTFDDLIDERISSRIKELVAAIQTEETLHDFSWALDMLKQGHKVARGEWKRIGVDRYLTAMTYRTDVCNAITDLAEYACDMTRKPRFIADICGDYAGVWGDNLSDILANDWYEVQ